VARFLHTADWQLGKAPHFLSDEARARFSAARVDVIGRIGELAAQQHCDFVVVCGDVFESNSIDRQILLRALEQMGSIGGLRFYLLPGNHDPLDASSIFESPRFRDHCPDNVTVLDGAAPLEAADGIELVAAPWPNKRPRSDLVADACGRLGPSDALRVVAAHGAVDAMWPESRGPELISLRGVEAALDAGLVHYVALGDRHSTTSVGETGRVWYSGAPEPTDFDEVDPGNVLVVDLDGEQARVEPHRVGTWSFAQRGVQLAGRADIDALDDWLGQFAAKSLTIVRLNLSGQLSVSQKARLDATLADHGEILATLDVREPGSEFVVIPDELDISDFGLSGYAGEALSDLVAAARSGGEQATDAREALTLLYRLVHAGGSDGGAIEVRR